MISSVSGQSSALWQYTFAVRGHVSRTFNCSRSAGQREKRRSKLLE